MWISNVRLVQQGRIQHCDIEIQQDRIREIYPVGSADRTQLFFDGQGRYLSHGFIDIHVHGGGGGDFMDGTEDAWRAATNLHLRHGTTGMVPTTLSASKEELLKAFSVLKPAGKILRTVPRFWGCIWKVPIFHRCRRAPKTHPSFVPPYTKNTVGWLRRMPGFCDGRWPRNFQAAGKWLLG